MNNDALEGQCWHTRDSEEVLQRLGTHPERGLALETVRERLVAHGKNAIQEAARRSVWRMILGQFRDFMVIVLIVAAVVSGIVGEPRDAIAIVVIVVLNAIVGAIQEYRAERAVAALRRMAAPDAQVCRNGEIQTIPATELAPGDIVLLEAGNVVPADLRLLKTSNLRIDEAALTGESQAIQKIPEALSENEAPLGDRFNMAYKGTFVSHGRATGVVVATGMETELGQIATLLQQEEAVKTPLQQRLAHFGQRLAVGVLMVCGIIFVTGLLRGEEGVLMFLTAVSLAVAAIPEALPAVVTVSLAMGARKMSRRNALIRRLPAVETLGSVTYICTDKTGTLTENRMTAEGFWVAGEYQSEIPPMASESPPWNRLGQALALCNEVVSDKEQGVRGDPTEVALYQAAHRAGYKRQSLEKKLPRIGDIPFDSERKRMMTVHRVSEREAIAFIKGAPEKILSRCSRMQMADEITVVDRGTLLREAERLAEQGYRVLAMAYRFLENIPTEWAPEILEKDLVFLGLVALIDPPRKEAPRAVADCILAGITPVMITGDHPGTARAIAIRLGIDKEDGLVIKGQDLAQIPAQDFAHQVRQIRTYARVTPEQKIRIVKALQDQGEFVAMTGDGVNDAPALKRAGIGVAMGRKGTDVAREAADMVLLDDNFATIVSAVREGRRIFDNIRKFVRYTMTSNSGEIWTLFLAPFLGLPLPLVPIQILWINLVTDGLPGLALSAEPQERGIMRRPPRPPNESIFAHGMWQHMLWVGLLIGGLSLLAQAWAYHSGTAHWQTMVFTVLTFCQLAHVLAIRSEKESLFTQGLLSNPWLLGAVAITVALQLAVIYLPFLNPIFRTAPLSMGELALCFVLPVVVFVAVEVEKWLVRKGWIYVNYA
ncbi:Cation transporting ATPase, E1-E2 type [Nitrosococcus oceani ATCC 19707]|uniref:Cation transporting ATPase, E1-E2 type n=2 Tax=Nitrosococcus oceani TaxID=1229 RepID=Q3J9A6_NITOC|nr:cation-translocating P-type ATPase [Nitrosococcus oceani]ABA58590.1 Cation transporting ATPase, E1-E2 type [Nitrosococcus oceani ATCC 19707]EDZ68195.1 ATPase, P-type, HAD superfamily, subfamily IC, putative [Nitrosococcus oceani AFC27]KFI18890.1 ATPase [Nitrosococcus oceani C-27]GEM19709.1 ATPase [Nitrosococcus oceani]